ncbi:MAG: flagellar hook-basal body complex protein FliE [Nitratireductor sp.]
MSATFGVGGIENIISSANSGQVADPFASAGVGAQKSSGTEFQQVLMDTGNDLVKSLANAEKTSIEGIKGNASAFDVATSVIEAEQSLKMAVAVRDKIVSAYLEISRMQI